MGYCMSQGKTKFFILAKNKSAALQDIKNLAGKETIEDSGGKHFKWVHTESFVNAETLEDALEAWRWKLTCNETGDVTHIEFFGEKYGDDMLLFKAIAPHVMVGSYITMHGEDGARWKWVFNGSCEEKRAKIVWED